MWKLLCVLMAVSMRTVLGLKDDPSMPIWGASPAYYVQVRMDDVSDSPQNPVWNFNYSYLSLADSGGGTFSTYEMDDKQADEVCKGLGHSGRCTLTHSTNDNWLYIAFPDSDFCCACSQNIGAVLSDWLFHQEPIANYTGQSTHDVDGNPFMNDVTADGWLKMGASDNYYYVTADDKQLPVRYMEHKNGVLKQWDFNLNTYVDHRKDWTMNTPAIFAPPANCDTRCKSSACKW